VPGLSSIILIMKISLTYIALLIVALLGILAFVMDTESVEQQGTTLSKTDESLSPKVRSPMTLGDSLNESRRGIEKQAQEASSLFEPETRPTFEVTGTVLDDLEQAFSQCKVELKDSAGRVVQTVRASGQGRFVFGPGIPGPPEGGIYFVGIAETSLPTGFTYPTKSYLASPGISSRYETKVIGLSPETPTAEVTLHVFKEAIVTGVVTDRLGMPHESAFASLSYAGLDFMPNSGRGSALTDANGRFEIVQVFPGNFRLRVQTLDKEMKPDGAIPPPLQELTIQGGGYYDLGYLQTGGADITIRGRIVNQDGDPFPNVPIAATPYREAQPGWRVTPLDSGIANATTDEDGVFVLEDLPQEHLRISLGDFLPGPPKAGTPAHWVLPIFEDLGSRAPSALVELGEHALMESRPFELQVTFDLEPSWLRANPKAKTKLRKYVSYTIELETPLPPYGGTTPAEYLEHWGGIPAFAGSDPSDLEHNTLTWVTETPRERCILTISSRDEVFEDIEFYFTPEPNGVLKKTFSIP
jgi:hypothetical protein